MNFSTYQFYAENSPVMGMGERRAPWSAPSMDFRRHFGSQEAYPANERAMWAMEYADFLTSYNARIGQGGISFAKFRGL